MTVLARSLWIGRDEFSRASMNTTTAKKRNYSEPVRRNASALSPSGSKWHVIDFEE